MVNVWVKVITDEKIKKSCTFSINKFNEDEISDFLIEAAYRLDISTPLLLEKHIKSFLEYNSATFLPDAFMEEVHFDKLVVELF